MSDNIELTGNVSYRFNYTLHETKDDRLLLKTAVEDLFKRFEVNPRLEFFLITLIVDRCPLPEILSNFVDVIRREAVDKHPFIHACIHNTKNEKSLRILYGTAAHTHPENFIQDAIKLHVSEIKHLNLSVTPIDLEALSFTLPSVCIKLGQVIDVISEMSSTPDTYANKTYFVFDEELSFQTFRTT